MHCLFWQDHPATCNLSGTHILPPAATHHRRLRSSPRGPTNRQSYPTTPPNLACLPQGTAAPGPTTINGHRIKPQPTTRPKTHHTHVPYCLYCCSPAVMLNYAPLPLFPVPRNSATPRKSMSGPTKPARTLNRIQIRFQTATESSSWTHFRSQSHLCSVVCVHLDSLRRYFRRSCHARELEFGLYAAIGRTQALCNLGAKNQPLAHRNTKHPGDMPLTQRPPHGAPYLQPAGRSLLLTVEHFA